MDLLKYLRFSDDVFSLIEDFGKERNSPTNRNIHTITMSPKRSGKQSQI